MNEKFDILVIGGGPAGIMAALTAKRLNKDKKVCIVEASDRIGKKLRITGGGRCNFTNNKDISCFFENTVRNEKFLYSALYTFSNEDMKAFVKALGLEYIVENNNDDKIYLKSGNSMELIKALEKELKKNDVRVFLNSKVKNIEFEGNSKKIYLENSCLESEKIIISTGGKSYPQTGSDGSLFKILEKNSYKIVETVSALSPIEIREKFLREIAGISLEKIDIYIHEKYSKKKRAKKIINGDIIFTHKGIGGPAALKSSSYINRDLASFYIEADFIPNMDADEIYEQAKLYPKKTVFNNLKDILPNNFLKLILKRAESLSESKFDFFEDQSANMSKKEIEYVVELLKKSKMTPKALCEIEKATVTSGGVSVSDIDSSTMESKIHKGVYFAGELIDVDALTGGYNLQIAFSTGYLAALNI